MSKTWKPLSRGDTIALVAPGYGCPEAECTRAAEWLREQGFAPMVLAECEPEEIRRPWAQHNDDRRFDQLLEALESEEVRAIWCMRGGYGATRLMAGFHRMPEPASIKPLIGYSDVTALHLHVGQHWGWPSLHAPVMAEIAMRKVGQENGLAVIDILSNASATLTHALFPMNTAAHQADELEGSVTGGNLSLLQASLGTFWEVQAEGRFLLVEEIGEQGYQLDRMLTHLRQAGVLAGCRALLIGDMTEAADKDGNDLSEEVLSLQAEALDIPVYRLPEVGHGPRNRCLPLGTDAEIRLTPDGNAVLEVATGCR